MDYPVVRIVDRVPTSAGDAPATLIDLNDEAPWTTLHDDFTEGVPQREGDPDSVGAGYGYRTVSLRPRMGGTPSEAAAALQTLARLLLKRRGTVLMLQVTAANDAVYFPLHPSQPGDLDWADAHEEFWQLRLDLTADPFACGPYETIGPVTINNDPAHATNPCFYKLPAIKGDAPSPVVIEIDPSGTWDEYDVLMSMAALDKTQNPTGPVVWQTGGFTAGTDTVHASDAAYSGGNKSTVSFATNAAMVTRLSGAAPAALTPGTYKVMCRMARVAAGVTTWAARFGQAYNLNEQRYGDTVRVDLASSGAGHAVWADLGEFAFPFGASGLEVADVASIPTVSLQVERTAGTGTMVVDCLLLIPVETAVTEDAATLVTRFAGYGLDAIRLGVWDGTKTPLRFRCLEAGSYMTPLKPPRLDGGVLHVRPDATNIFHLLHQTRVSVNASAAAPTPDLLSASASVTFRYSPRYVHLRPDAD